MRSSWSDEERRQVEQFAADDLDQALRRKTAWLKAACRLVEHCGLLPSLPVELQAWWVAQVETMEKEAAGQEAKARGLAKLTPEERRAMGL